MTDSANKSNTGGMSSDTKTPANSDMGQSSHGVFDAKGAIGKEFTGNSILLGAVNCLATNIYFR
jgi:hypothetical protein